MTFQEWYRQVDMEVSALIGVGIDDLADYRSRDCYDDGYSPEEYAREAIENDDLFCNFPLD